VQPDALCASRVRGLLASIPVMDVGQGDVLTRDILDGFGETADFLAIPDVGGRDVQGQQMPQRINSHVRFCQHSRQRA
jgi:hypothetical protein